MCESVYPCAWCRHSKDVNFLPYFDPSSCVLYWTPLLGESSKPPSRPASRLLNCVSRDTQQGRSAQTLTFGEHPRLGPPHFPGSFSSSALRNSNFKVSPCPSLFACHRPSPSRLPDRRNNLMYFTDNKKAIRVGLADLPPPNLPENVFLFQACSSYVTWSGPPCPHAGF